MNSLENTHRIHCNVLVLRIFQIKCIHTSLRIDNWLNIRFCKQRKLHASLVHSVDVWKVPLTVQFPKCAVWFWNEDPIFSSFDIDVIQNGSWETSASLFHTSKQERKKDYARLRILSVSVSLIANHRILDGKWQLHVCKFHKVFQMRKKEGWVNKIGAVKLVCTCRLRLAAWI